MKNLFLIFIKQSTINLDCFTSEQYVYDYSPIKKSSAFLPDWIKNLPKSGVLNYDTLDLDSNVRTCSGIMNQVTKGFIMPLWSDLLIEVGKEGTDGTCYRWRFSDDVSKISTHCQSQRGEYLPETKYQHLKIDTPWLFKTKEDVSWQCISPLYNQSNPELYTTLPGIVDYKYQNSTNIQLIIPKSNNGKIIKLDRGTPMYQFIPLTEKKVVVHNHIVSKEEYAKIQSNNTRFMFVNKHKKLKTLGCPFHN